MRPRIASVQPMALRNLRGFHSSKLNTIRQISFATTTTSHLLINHEVGLLKPLFVAWRYSGFPEKWPFSADSEFPQNGVFSNFNSPRWECRAIYQSLLCRRFEIKSPNSR